jgi:hypothetical protein
LLSKREIKEFRKLNLDVNPVYEEVGDFADCLDGVEPSCRKFFSTVLLSLVRVQMDVRWLKRGWWIVLGTLVTIAIKIMVMP